jgi:hypothetical protein
MIPNAATLAILIHHYFLFENYKVLREDSKTSLDAYNWLMTKRMISACQDGFEVTDKGRCHVKALLEAPLPVQSWVSPLEVGI